MDKNPNIDSQYKGIEKQMIDYAFRYYDAVKKKGTDRFFFFFEDNLDIFRTHFKRQTDKIARKMKNGHYPDRHKIIAAGLKAFLYAHVFQFSKKDFDKLKPEQMPEETISINILLPNEMYCLDMVAFFINQYAPYKGLDNYSLRLPDHIFNYADNSTHCYVIDLFQLFHGYTEARLDFAVQELAHILFFVELGYELNTFDLKAKYYSQADQERV